MRRFSVARPLPRRRGKPTAITPEQFFADLQPGDYVVHVDHGIGIFQGLIKLTLDGVENEYLQLAYAAGDKLYVPIHQADRLSKYIGADDHAPDIHRLGTADWSQVRSKAKEAALEVARELLELYACARTRARLCVQSRFDVAERIGSVVRRTSRRTINCARSVKSKPTWRKPRPMDRLICGDVGYGKTEVALRAAFKAVQDGKQVARARADDDSRAATFHHVQRAPAPPSPSRSKCCRAFDRRRNKQKSSKRLREGNVDIIIGTHRLLQRDVRFKDLGLLIIDEEQRFGVTHKEQFKKLRTEVDVLTLTATPIPRTLYMSLVGVRDISTIDTPPEERLPVATYVGEYDDHLVRQAILRELDRGGQVFSVHNRVIGIEQINRASQVDRARSARRHRPRPDPGPTPTRTSDDRDFVKGGIDVLLCTSIIESGLDIPNANTLIVDRGRSLWAWRSCISCEGASDVARRARMPTFSTTKYRGMTEEARRRLEAIREANEPGHGLFDCDARSRNSRRGRSCSACGRAGTSARSALISTRNSCSAPSANCARSVTAPRPRRWP